MINNNLKRYEPFLNIIIKSLNPQKALSLSAGARPPLTPVGFCGGLARLCSQEITILAFSFPSVCPLIIRLCIAYILCTSVGPCLLSIRIVRGILFENNRRHTTTETYTFRKFPVPHWCVPVTTWTWCNTKGGGGSDNYCAGRVIIAAIPDVCI